MSLTTAAVAVLVIAGGVLIVTVAPRSGLAKAAATLLPSARPHALAAEAAFAGGDWRLAEAETRKELAVSPTLDAAWLRLARIDVAQTGRIGAKGSAALAHAYDAAPYDVGETGSRRWFVQVRLADLPSTLRADAEAESVALSTMTHAER